MYRPFVTILPYIIQYSKCLYKFYLLPGIMNNLGIFKYTGGCALVLCKCYTVI